MSFPLGDDLRAEGLPEQEATSFEGLTGAVSFPLDVRQIIVTSLQKTVKEDGTETDSVKWIDIQIENLLKSECFLRQNKAISYILNRQISCC